MLNIKNIQKRLTLLFLSNKERADLLLIIKECLAYGFSIFAIFNDVLPTIYKKGNLKMVIHHVFLDISNGSNFSEAISYWYDHTLTAIIASGEQMDDFSSSLDLAVELLSSNANILHTFMSKIIYSTFSLVLSFGVLYIFSSEIFPEMLSGLNVNHLPEPLKLYIDYYTFVFHGGLINILIIIIAMLLGFIFMLENYTGIFRKKFDKLPFFFMYRKVQSSHYLMQLGYYFKANVLLDVANKKISHSSGKYLKMHCANIEKKLSDGVYTVVEALGDGFLTDENYHFLYAMSKVGQFENKCVNFAKKIRTEIVTKVSNIGKVMSTLLMICTALNLAWSLTSIYALTNVIQQGASLIS